MISILDLALRADTPVHVRPPLGGWLAHRCVGSPGEPEFVVDDDPLLLVEPIALEPALAAEAAGGGKLHHITGPGVPLRLLPEVGYTRWGVAAGWGDLAGSQVDVDETSAVRVAVREGYVLGEPRQVTPDALLVDEVVADLMAAAPGTEPADAADEANERLWTIAEVARYLNVSDDKARRLTKAWSLQAPGLRQDCGPRLARVDPVILRAYLTSRGSRSEKGSSATKDAAKPRNRRSYDDGLFDLVPLRRKPR